MVTEGMAMEATITVMAATTVIMAMAIGTTGTMVTGVATAMGMVVGGAGAGMVMGLEPVGPGRHMATGGFATKFSEGCLPNGLRTSDPQAHRDADHWLRKGEEHWPRPRRAT
jgi:hypothetical protein